MTNSSFLSTKKRLVAVLLLAAIMVLLIPSLPRHEWHLYYWSAAFLIECCVIWMLSPLYR